MIDEPKRLIFPLFCQRTGVELGTLNLIQSAGHVAQLSQWNENIVIHPFFSWDQFRLTTFMRDEWNRLAKEIDNETISETNERNLRVGFVALLYSLGSIQRDQGCISFPDISTVQSNLESLCSLASWQNYLDSKRFSFPDLHISRINNNADLKDIGDYLSACWDRRKDYENGLTDIIEQERIKSAEKVIVAIRNSFMGIPNKKLLWTWVTAHLDKKWEPDAAGWMRTLFVGTVSQSLIFDIEEINLLEEIIVSCCPIGNSVMFSVRERIESIRVEHNKHYDTFTIEEDSIELIQSITDSHAGTEEPVEKDFKNKALYFVAKAKWQLANPVGQTARVRQDIESARDKLNVGLDEL